MKRLWIVLNLVVVATAAWSAVPPESINYQGVLRDSNDDPLDGDFDMVFRLWDAETGGLILLRDSHTAAGTGAVTVTGGLFNVHLGGGTLTAGVYGTLAEVFANQSDVWLQIQVGTEFLNPRVRIVSAGYALNASHLEGRAAAEFLDTSSASQRKFGPLWLDASAIAEWGVRGAGQVGGGYFWDSDGSGYGYVGYQDLGIVAQGDFAGGYFKDRVQSGFAYVGVGEVGIEAYGDQSGGYFADLDGSGHAYVGFGDRGIHALGNEMGGYFKDNDDSGYAELGAQNIGVKGYGSFLGGYFADSDGSGYARVGYGDRGIEAYGNQYAGYFGGNVYVTGDLVANIVQADTIDATAGGIRFPDGTVQTSSTGALANLASRLDTGDLYSATTSIAVGSDGLPVISYEGDSGDLKVAHCDNALCSSATLSTLDSTGTVGKYSSIAIGTDNLPVISYWDQTNANLKVAHCNDALCSSAALNTVDGTGVVAGYTSIAIGTDGRPVISYGDITNSFLKVAHCDDALCSSAVLNTVDGTGVAVGPTSIAIGVDGLPVIGYYAYVGGDLKVAHCDDVPCSSATLNTVDSAGLTGSGTSLAIGADGLPVISYHDASNLDLRVAHCDDTVCSSATLNTLDSAGIAGQNTSIAIAVDGLPVISYWEAATGDLDVAYCDDTVCSSATLHILDSAGQVGQFPSIAIGADGKPVISYYDATNLDLKVMTQVTIAQGGSSTSMNEMAKHDDPSVGAAPNGHTGPGLVSRYPRPGSTAGQACENPLGIRTDDEGNVYAKSFRPSDTDFATKMNVAEPVEPGDVLVIDPERPGLMSLARLPADSAVFGIVAGEPGLLLGAEPPEGDAREDASSGQQPTSMIEATVAVSGVASCKVDAGYGPIRPGDLLTSSPTPGHAMLAYEPRPGTILGKALEPLDSGTGVIAVLVMLR